MRNRFPGVPRPAVTPTLCPVKPGGRPGCGCLPKTAADQSIAARRLEPMRGVGGPADGAGSGAIRMSFREIATLCPPANNLQHIAAAKHRIARLATRAARLRRINPPESRLSPCFAHVASSIRAAGDG
jgi:hypothetical protein